MASNQVDYKSLFDKFQTHLENAIAGAKKAQPPKNTDSNPGTSSDIRNKNVDNTRVAPTVTTKRSCEYTVQQQHHADLKRPKRMSINDTIELKFRCSFCSARFSSLTMVRDHTRACHREENLRRREVKNTKVISVVGNSNTGTQNQNMENKSTFLFRCVACKFASVSYNHMIEHCQYHVTKSENPEVIVSRSSTRKCVISDEEFDVDFETYSESKDGSNYNYTSIYCDYNLLRQDKWPAVVDNIPKADIDKINCGSIYYFTRIIRLTSRKKASSAPFMVFLCEKCQKHIDPHSVLAHVVENSCYQDLPEYPCYDCKRPFLDENTMYLHYKMHPAAVSSNMKFRTVFFNHKDDDFFNALLLKAAGVIMKNVQNRKKNVQTRLSNDTAQIQVKNSPATNTLKGIEHSPQKGASRSNLVQSILSFDVAKTQIQVKISPQGKDIQRPTELTPQNVPNWSKFVHPKLSSGVTKKQIQIKTSPAKDTGRSTEITPQNTPKVSQLQKLLTSGAKEPIQLKIVLEKHDARSMIIPGTKTTPESKTVSPEITKNIAENTNKTITVYKCQCELSFHELDFLSRHLEKCPLDKTASILCACGLLFDEKQYQVHCGIHSQGITELNVKRITMRDDKININGKCDEKKIIGINNRTNKRDLDHNQLCKKAISQLVDTIQNVTSSLPHIKREIFDDDEIQCVGSRKDVIKALKDQGTMTERDPTIGNEVTQVNRKSVGTGTEDFNIMMFESQGTMSMIEDLTVYENNEIANRKQTSDIKSLCPVANDLNKPIIKIQGTIPRRVSLSSREVNKELINTMQASGTKLANLVPDTLNELIRISYGNIAVVAPEIQTSYEVNKDKSNEKDGKTMVLPSEAADVKHLKSLTMMTKEDVQDITKIVSNNGVEPSIVEKELDDVSSKFDKPIESLNCGTENKEGNQSTIEITIEAETQENDIDKAKDNHNTESTGNICETKTNVTEQNTSINDAKHEDQRKIVAKVCDQTQKSLDMNERDDTLETLIEKDKANEKTSVTNESEKNNVIDSEQVSTDSKIYTEDELLNVPENTEMPNICDIHDEDPILLYEEDDIDDAD
ncbi:uncharacterized protein LOC125239391 [Leguminivora glycinivorella]|uniref:uncharacterized protein LOC125239391 n=1 Tax=Leguminivora glycinivorella TaxID=1035111 RepID=UPI00200D7648|nr:uncharacterized protein LOC125239391 [Leguminivora glycinivorella]